jgi:DNA-binding LacI/PurR family transcriptional regulator
MKMNKVTLNQMADVLNYSISTISKALYNREEISFDTKIKIVETPKKIRLQAAQQYIKFNCYHRCYYF